MESENIKLMEKIPVSKAILKLSLPTVLSTIISLLYNLTDTYFIGLLDDPIQLGAISLTFPAFIIIQAIGNIFGNGAPSYISRCLGAKREDEARKTSAVSVYSSVCATLVMTIFCFIFMNPILDILGTSPDTVGPTRSYLQIIVGLSFIMTLQIILPAMLRSEGKVKQAVTGMIIGTILNIILDPLFIMVFDLGVAGAAWATMIGNSFAVIYYLMVYLKGNTALSVKFRDFSPSKRIFSQVLKIGFPTSLAQVIMSFSNIILNNIAGNYGDYVISAYGVSGKLIMMVFMITMGYVSGYMPFAGYNFGSGNIKRLTAALKFTVLSGTGICLFLLIPFIWLAPAFLEAFTTEPQIIETGTAFLRAQAWAVPFMAIQLSMMSTFQATGQAIRATIVNLGRQCIFYIPFLYLFNYLWGLQGLLYAQMAADLCTTVTAVLIGVSLLHKLHKQNSSQPI